MVVRAIYHFVLVFIQSFDLKNKLRLINSTLMQTNSSLFPAPSASFKSPKKVVRNEQARAIFDHAAARVKPAVMPSNTRGTCMARVFPRFMHEQLLSLVTMG